MESENIFLLYALFMGIFITFVYDILRIFRRVIPHGVLLVSLEDIGFWIYCGAKVFLLMYHESNGTLRWFAVLGALMGMILYKRLVSCLFVKYASLLLQKIVQVLVKIGKFISTPVLRLLQKAKNTAKKRKAKASRNKSHIRWLRKKKLTFLRKMLK